MSKVTVYSDAEAVRCAVRVEDGRLVAYPFDAENEPTETEMDFGPVAGADLAAVFDRVRYVFSVAEIAG